MPEYYYASKIYQSVDDVETAVTGLKNQLENSPTIWCTVKPQINTRQMQLDDGTEITVFNDGDALSDTEIMALSSSDEGLYHIYAIVDGDNLTDLSAEDTISNVARMRNSYARWVEADKYFEIPDDTDADNIEIAVSNEDMSIFTT